MAKTRCPARYKNLGLETFGNKKKVTEELLTQFCKNDEYLYQQIRKLLDLTDPESRKRFHPPYFEDEIKSFGYATGEHYGKKCYMFNDGGDYSFGVDFNTRDDNISEKEGIIYYNDESIIDWDKNDDTVDIHVINPDETGYAQIALYDREEITKPITTPQYTNEVKAKKTTYQVTTKQGNPVKDSYCYGPYGSMLPNGWWYVGFDENKNYSVKPYWKKHPYTEGIPSKCRAQTFTAQHTGYITKVNINIISSSNKKSVSPFSCEIWKTKNGKPYGGAIARATKSFKDSNAFSGAHIKTFKFNKKAVVTKGHKYAIVMRSPLSHEGACYRIAGWPRTCYTNYMKGTYYYGYAYQSLDNGKTWLRYDKSAYSKLHASKGTMPVAFGFEVYVQPTKTVKKTRTIPAKKKKIIGYKTEYQGTGEYRDVYTTGNHFLYFKLPITNPIYWLHIDADGCSTENNNVNGNEILWEISYNGEDWNNNDLISDMGGGAGTYDLSESRPTFITIRCNLKNTDKYSTPILRSVKFFVKTDPTKKTYIRTLPYTPESETMLPACIWSEVNAEYEADNDVDVGIDVVKEVDATQTVSIREDTIDALWSYYRDYYSDVAITTFQDDDEFRKAIQDDPDFINHLKTDLEPPVYVVSAYPRDDEKYYDYFENIELRNYPAYPIVSCNQELGEIIVGAEDFEHGNFNAQHTEYTMTLNKSVEDHLVKILFREPQNPSTNQEGVIENVLEEGVDYRISDDGKSIIFLMDGTNLVKNIVTDENGIKCFKLSEGTFDRTDDWDDEGQETWDIVEVDTDYTGDDGENDPYSSENINITTGDVIELVIELQDTAYSEHVNYTIDYDNKLMIPRPSMKDNLTNCELNITYNPLWVRDLTSDVLPLKMDMWTEGFTVNTSHVNDDGKVTYTTRVAPRDNLREVVLYDDEDSLTRQELIEDIDFVVDYQKNKIVFNNHIDYGTPVTIRYTPNLTETSLSLCYRLNREDTGSQAYVYSNYFTTRT